MDRDFWSGLYEWLQEVPLKRSLISADNFDCISLVDTPDEAYEIISAHHKVFLEKKNSGPSNAS